MLDGKDTAISDTGYRYWEMDTIKLEEDFSAQKYRENVRHDLKKLHNLQLNPIIVGGTIHWINSLVSNSVSAYYVSSPGLYYELLELTLAELQAKYRSIYPEQKINESDWQNPRRLARAIEYFIIAGKSVYAATKHITDEFDYLVIQTQIERQSHREKIQKSVESRIDKGWIEEVENILQKYDDSILNKLGQGYRIIGNYILNEKKESLDFIIKKITIAEMRYAKKQRFSLPESL